MMETAMADLDQELAAYEELRPELEAHHMGQWVLVHDKKLIDVFDDFNSAAQIAVEQFGRGPYLIHQVGSPPVVLPASVMYRHHDL